MGKSMLLLPVLLVTLTGCVVTYGNFPDASVESLPKDHAPKSLSYHITPAPQDFISFQREEDPIDYDNLVMLLLPNWYPLRMKDYSILEVRQTLEASGMFSELILREASPPDKGLYVKILFSVHPPFPGTVGVAVGQGIGCIILPLCPFLVWGIIPYYSGEAGLTVDYQLYQDGEAQHSYEYRIHKKGAGGLLLLPFAWINFFTDDLKDALRATTLQFLIDAHRDGHL